MLCLLSGGIGAKQKPAKRVQKECQAHNSILTILECSLKVNRDVWRQGL